MPNQTDILVKIRELLIDNTHITTNDVKKAFKTDKDLSRYIKKLSEFGFLSVEIGKNNQFIIKSIEIKEEEEYGRTKEDQGRKTQRQRNNKARREILETIKSYN